MFDTEEYLITLEEQIVATRGVAESTEQFLRLVRDNETDEGKIWNTLYKLQGYRIAYEALNEHANTLWNKLGG